MFKKLHFILENPTWALVIAVAKIKGLLYYKFKFKNFGSDSIILKPIRVTYGFIDVGNDVFVWQNCRIEGVARYLNRDFSPRISIGDYVSIQQNLHLTCANSIYIGKNSSIAANVTITDIYHPHEDINLAPDKQDILTVPVSIGEDCKIYNNVVILPGVVLGKHVIVGANSVVKKGNYPDFCVLAGIPARVIKRYCFIQDKWVKTDKYGNILDKETQE